MNEYIIAMLVILLGLTPEEAREVLKKNDAYLTIGIIKWGTTDQPCQIINN